MLFFSSSRRSRKSSKPCPLSVEKLEAREVPAATSATQFVSGVLVETDAQDNFSNLGSDTQSQDRFVRLLGRTAELSADAHQTVINVDADWLAERGTGSYSLDQAGARYVLQTDVRTNGTAFVVGAADVTLDLNGHTVTYGDSSPVRLYNGGFEVGTGRNAPGWNLSRAPSASIANNSSFLFGAQVLRLSNVTTTQRIDSVAISIRETDRPYVATITPANPEARVKVKLSVVDTVTGAVLGSGTSTNVERGFSAVTHFTPKTRNPVKLVIEVTPQVPGTSVDLDAATLTVAGDYGIVATHQWSETLVGWGQLSEAARQSYRKAANFTVRNGSIVQGSGHGYASSALYFHSLPGFVVDNVTTHVNGMDTIALQAVYAKDHVTVRNSVFRSDVPNVSNRMHNHAAINLTSTDATIVVQGSTILDSAQAGIVVARSNPAKSILIDGNEIRQDAVVTNGYGIVLSAVQRFVVSNNVIAPKSGRGILLDGYSHQPLGNGEIFGNTVDVQERFNREQPRRLQARALRMRNNVDRMGMHRNLYVHDNTFIARTGEGLAEEAHAARISYVNVNGEMNNANIVLERNFFGAYVSTPSTEYRAKALVLDQVDAGINLVIKNNVLKSNDTSLAVTDTEGSVSDVRLVGTTLSRWQDALGRFYVGIRAGFWNRDVVNVQLLGTTAENVSSLVVEWAGTGSKELIFGTHRYLSGPKGQSALGERTLVAF